MGQISKYGKRAEDILFYLYNNGEVPLTYLKNIVSSSYTYYRVIQLFESDGIVKSRERIHNRKYILISLTDKGKWAVREYFSVPGDADPGHIQGGFDHDRKCHRMRIRQYPYCIQKYFNKKI